jgi:hypothetical protein
MNTWIRTLLNEATSGIDPDLSIQRTVTANEMEKFAELIVRECMKCSDPLVSHYINTHTEQEQAPLLAAIADYSSEIKKHFGVEE